MNKINIPWLLLALILSMIFTMVSIALVPTWLGLGILGEFALFVIGFYYVTSLVVNIRKAYLNGESIKESKVLGKSNKNATAAKAQKLFALCDAFKSDFKNITYSGIIVLEETNPLQFDLRNRYNTVAVELENMLALWHELKPLVDSRDEIERLPSSVKRQSEIYGVYIKNLYSVLPSIQKPLKYNVDPLPAMTEEHNSNIENVFYSGRDKALNTIDPLLSRTQKLLEVFIRSNAE